MKALPDCSIKHNCIYILTLFLYRNLPLYVRAIGIKSHFNKALMYTVTLIKEFYVIFDI